MIPAATVWTAPAAGIAEERDQVVKVLADYGSETHPDDVDMDYEGQLIFYTNVYRWEDGSYHDEAQPSGQVEESPVSRVRPTIAGDDFPDGKF